MSILEFIPEDDLSVAIDPATYRDQSNPPPVSPGYYRMVVDDYDWRKDENGNLELRDGVWPTLIIKSVKITEGLEPRKVYLWQDVKFKPLERDGETASPAQDLLRAYDATAATTGLKDNVNQILQHIVNGTSFVAKIDWTAYDRTYADQQFENAGGREMMELKDQYAVYRNARVRGYKKFPKLPSGRHAHTMLHLSGMQIEARPEITRFFPTNAKQPTLGPVPEFADAF